MDLVLWGVAVLLFFGSAVHWLLLPLAVSWLAWVGFVVGSVFGAAYIGGPLPISLICGFLVAWLAHKVHGYWLATHVSVAKPTAPTTSMSTAALDDARARRPARQTAPVRSSVPEPRRHHNTRLLYRVAPHNGGAVFAEEKRAALIAQMHRAIEEAQTWGEFAQLMPESEYQSILKHFREEGEPTPASAEPFSGNQIGGYSDGDYPPWLQSEMDLVIPEDILERFGKQETTFLNGSFWHIPEEQMEPMANALRERGFEVVKAEDLPFH